MKKRTFRKSIRIDGKLVSKEFANKASADTWYSQMHTKKQFASFGLRAPKAKNRGILLKEYALGEFMALRRANYPQGTWKSDEQRLNDYVVPALGNIPMAAVKASHVRAMLNSLVEKRGLSPKTRDRVQALVSIMFSEAINREGGALVDSSPTFGIAFRRGKRVGVKPPSYLHTHEDCLRFLKAARELSIKHLCLVALGILAGLRKQEMIALKFKHFSEDSHCLEIREKFEQCSGKILKGTKAGQESIRHVPTSGALERIINELRKGSKFKREEDFVLQGADGSHLNPRTLFKMNAEVCAKSGLTVSVHGLRHTFGREFAQRSGNLKALQDILGHSNFSTTQLYTSLGKERLKEFRDVMDVDI